MGVACMYKIYVDNFSIQLMGMANDSKLVTHMQFPWFSVLNVVYKTA